MANGPVSVVLSASLRQRLTKLASARTVGLSTVLRQLAEERLTELESDSELSRAERWQRAQAWEADAEPGDEVPWEQLEVLFDADAGASQSLRGSSATRRRSSGGSAQRTVRRPSKR